MLNGRKLLPAEAPCRSQRVSGFQRECRGDAARDIAQLARYQAFSRGTHSTERDRGGRRQQRMRLSERLNPVFSRLGLPEECHLWNGDTPMEMR